MSIVLDGTTGLTITGATTASTFGGVVTTAVSDGTFTGGNYVPSTTGGNMRYITNNGAFTIAAPTAAGDYTMIIQITNAATLAGTITLTGFTRTVGDALTTTANSKFLVNITKINSLILASVVALQ